MRPDLAVITAAGARTRDIPLQRMVDRSGRTRSVISIILDEVAVAGVDDVCIVVAPGYEDRYADAARDCELKLTLLPQLGPAGYGRAIQCASRYVNGRPFLHIVGDHLFSSRSGEGCASQLVATAEQHDCSVSGVRATRETLLPYFGAVGGRRIPGEDRLFAVERVIEKPTPTVAEQELLVPGLRAGHYLCFLSLHVFSPTVMHLLDERVATAADSDPVELSSVLNELAQRELYIAQEAAWDYHALDGVYGMMFAQMALALEGQDRDRVLTRLVEMLARDGDGRQ